MIHVVVPVYNERHTVGVLLWRIREVFSELKRDFRILVLDDGSTDGTSEVLEPYRRVLPLEVFRHETCRGFEASLERLLREAVKRSEYPRRDGVLVMQGDFTDGPETISDLLRRFQGGADLVSAATVGGQRAKWPLRVSRVVASVLLRRLQIPAETGDVFSSYRLYRVAVIKRTLAGLSGEEPLLRHRGWAASVELLAAVTPHVRQFLEVDTSYNPDRRYRSSRFRPLPQMWGLFRATGDRRLRASFARSAGG